MLKTILRYILILDLIAVNAILGFLAYDYYQTPNQPQVVQNTPQQIVEVEPKEDQTCSQSCEDLITKKISEIEIPVQEKEVVVRETTTGTTSQVTAKRTVSYVPVPGSGSANNTDWTNLPSTSFYLSKSDFTGLKEVYFEANMYLKNGNGKAYLRIFDKTNGVAVSGSQIETSSQTSAFVSGGPIYLWEGTNQYVIQAKSLTADTTYFESGRLKLILEN